MGKSENSVFLETIATCDLKIGSGRQIIEFIIYLLENTFFLHNVMQP